MEKIEMEMTNTTPIRKEFENIYDLAINHAIDITLERMTDNFETNKVLIDVVKRLRKLQSKP